VAAGLEVIAVEPHEALRDVLAQKIGPGRVREGLAEAIPLQDGSVDAVTVADAFHWFEPGRAMAEIRRVLRPGGGLAVIAMVPEWSGASWGHELGTLIVNSRPQHPHFDGPPWQEAVRAAGGWTEPREIRVTASRPVRPDQIVDHLASISWIAAMPVDEREEILGRIRALVVSGETPDELPIHVVIGLATLA
jgi:SAM-dependent methyltransferase